MSTLATRLQQAVLLVPGPFFCHPLKPFMNMALGSGYDSAYQHFRRDHSKPSNLALHCLCLAYQLSANFALLEVLDVALGLPYYLGLGSLTAVAWIGALVMGTTQARQSNIVTAVLIVTARMAAPFIAEHTLLLEASFAASFAVVSVTTPTFGLPRSLIPGLLATAWRFGPSVSLASATSEHSMETCAVIALLMFLVAAGLKKPLVPLVIFGLVAIRAASISVGAETLLGRGKWIRRVQPRSETFSSIFATHPQASSFGTVRLLHPHRRAFRMTSRTKKQHS
jgi:hypothetical protein